MSAANVESSITELRFMTGGQAGTYYGFGQLLAGHAADSAGLAVPALVSDGSKANVEALADGFAEFGFCQTDVMSYAYDGDNLYEGMAISSFSAVTALYDEQVHIVTCNPDIETVNDLVGKRVSIGAPGSGTYFNAIDVLGVYGITEDDITPTYQSFGDSIESLKSGQIDASIIVAGAPVPAVVDLVSSRTARLLPLDDEQAEQLLSVSPHYSEDVIEADTYQGIGEDTKTVSVGAAMIAADTASEGDVYAFLADIFACAEDENAARAHEAYGRLSVEKGASIGSVPYHPGAARYFQERGFSVHAK